MARVWRVKGRPQGLRGGGWGGIRLTDRQRQSLQMEQPSHSTFSLSVTLFFFTFVCLKCGFVRVSWRIVQAKLSLLAPSYLSYLFSSYFFLDVDTQLLIQPLATGSMFGIYKIQCVKSVKSCTKRVFVKLYQKLHEYFCVWNIMLTFKNYCKY